MDFDNEKNDTCQQMVDYLEHLLTCQLERVRNYDLDSAMEIAEEAHKVSTALGDSKVLDDPVYVNERTRIQRLYKDLGLIIASERQEVSDKLKQIRKSIKTLGVYANAT